MYLLIRWEMVSKCTGDYCEYNYRKRHTSKSENVKSIEPKDPDRLCANARCGKSVIRERTSQRFHGLYTIFIIIFTIMTLAAVSKRRRRPWQTLNE